MNSDLDERPELGDGPDPHERRRPDERPQADRAAEPRVREIRELDERPDGGAHHPSTDPGPEHGVGPQPPTASLGPPARAEIATDGSERLVLAHPQDRDLAADRRIPRAIELGRSAGRPGPPVRVLRPVTTVLRGALRRR